VIVRRCVSLVLALILAASSAVVSSAHVHAYAAGHDHPEHRHGPASHGDDQHHASRHAATHDHHAAQDDHDGLGAQDRHDAQDRHHGGLDGAAGFHADACDAGDHVLKVPAAAGPLARAHVQLAVLTIPITGVPVSSGRLAAAPIDVRVHGPPPDTRLPARAPPLTSLA
jgi:hypothetical protein